MVEACVVPGRVETFREQGTSYVAAADISSGRNDRTTVCIAHYDKAKKRVVIDLLRGWNPPFNPYLVIGEVCQVLRDWGIKRVTADNFAANFSEQAFRDRGIEYQKCSEPKSRLYTDFLLPMIASKSVALLDHAKLRKELCALERRSGRFGGKESVDHPSGPGHHDDFCNSVALACFLASKPRITVGAAGF
jgi:hypothetical protein